MVHGLAGNSLPMLLNGGSTVTVRNRLLQLSNRMLTRRKRIPNPIIRVKIHRHHHHRIQFRVSRIKISKVQTLNPVLNPTLVLTLTLNLPPILSLIPTTTTNRHCPVSTCSKSVPVSIRRRKRLSEPCSAGKRRSGAGLNSNFQHLKIYNYESPRR